MCCCFGLVGQLWRLKMARMAAKWCTGGLWSLSKLASNVVRHGLQARELADLLRRYKMQSHVNIIPW